MKRLLRGENVVVGTGARASIDDGIPGIVLTQPLTYVEALELNVVPEH
jgi:pyruvate/2-oxoglutarate dehydrogenase complex dihydrolipoamide dehydrogenase (E3) component